MIMNNVIVSTEVGVAPSACFVIVLKRSRSCQCCKAINIVCNFSISIYGNYSLYYI